MNPLEKPAGSWLAETGLRLSEWFEHWFPDAFSLACVALMIVFGATLLLGNSPLQSARWFGEGFWDLVAFTMQMALIILTGYAVAMSAPVFSIIRRLAGIPRTGRSAAAFVGLFSMLSSLVSWSFSLVFSALLAKEVTRRVHGADYRAVGAAAYLGVGSVWALGLSSSAALIMASPASLPPSILRISGVIPLGQTIGLWQSMAVALVLGALSYAICYYSAPEPAQARGMADMGVTYRETATAIGRPQRPGEWLEHSRLLTVFVGACGLAYIVSEAATKGLIVLLDLNHFVFAFLIAGLVLHGRPRSFTNAIAAGVPSVAGVLIQYPLYAGIVRMMTESGLAKRLAEFFIHISTAHTFPLLVGVYSAVLGLFIPSAGGKWLVEAPYMLAAATTLKVHLGWVVQTYNATEALANLIHPFWMLPLLGILELKARDIVGYATLQFVVHVPTVLFLVWALSYTLSYVPPGFP